MVKNKLNKIEKNDRKTFLSRLNKAGGHVFSFKGDGLTVVIEPCAGRNSTHARVSVALCGKGDKFSTKRGQYEALLALNTGGYIPVRLPINTPLNSTDFEYIAEGIREYVA